MSTSDTPEGAILSLEEGFSAPRLRFRRFAGGYRRDDVELLLAEFRLTIRALELELTTLRERARDLEERLRTARGEVDSFHARGFELAHAITLARGRADEIEHSAKTRAAALAAEAEQQAREREAQVRADLERRLRELQALDRLKGDLLDSLRGVADSIGETLERAEGDALVLPIAAPPSADAEAADEDPEESREGDGHLRRDRPDPDAVYTEWVELDAGPFEDYDALSAFEHELTRIPKVQDVHVQALDGERALIELRMSECAPVVAELREHLSRALRIRGTNGHRLVLDLAASAAERR